MAEAPGTYHHSMMVAALAEAAAEEIGADATLAALPRPASEMRIELLIGAEGGLAPEELEKAVHAGFVGIRLGPRILRTETAGLAALAAMQCLWGDFGEGEGHV